MCWGTPEDAATIIVNLPVRATPEFRPQTGEFLHRLNFGSKRKFWEFHHNDGEIRLSAYMDTIIGHLTSGQFRGLLHCMIKTADTVFPYLTSILSGRMTPEFAADQAEAAVNALWKKDEQTKELTQEKMADRGELDSTSISGIERVIHNPALGASYVCRKLFELGC